MPRRSNPVCPATSSATRFCESDWRRRPDGRSVQLLPEHAPCSVLVLSPEPKPYSWLASLVLKRAGYGLLIDWRQVALHPSLSNLSLNVGFERSAFLR